MPIPALVMHDHMSDSCFADKGFLGSSPAKYLANFKYGVSMFLFGSVAPFIYNAQRLYIMRFELVLLAITAAIMANIYTEGKFIKNAMTYKKYYQMAGVALGAFVIYYMFRKNPANAHRMIASSNEYLKYLPVDRNTSSMLSPILDFTSKYSGLNVASPMLDLSSGQPNDGLAGIRAQYGGAPQGPAQKATKRSVSETKKKWVAASQSWKCGECGHMLPSWFEVDHKIRLEYGGSNHVDNLVALCRDCHGKKTAIENL